MAAKSGDERFRLSLMNQQQLSAVGKTLLPAQRRERFVSGRRGHDEVRANFVRADQGRSRRGGKAVATQAET